MKVCARVCLCVFAHNGFRFLVQQSKHTHKHAKLTDLREEKQMFNPGFPVTLCLTLSAIRIYPVTDITVFTVLSTDPQSRPNVAAAAGPNASRTPRRQRCASRRDVAQTMNVL